MIIIKFYTVFSNSNLDDLQVGGTSNSELKNCICTLPPEQKVKKPSGKTEK